MAFVAMPTAWPGVPQAYPQVAIGMEGGKETPNRGELG